VTTYEYEIRVPALAETTTGWAEPAKQGTVETWATWAGTAHDLGRSLLRNWYETCPEPYVGEKAYIEVNGDDGRHAKIDDPSPAGTHTGALEAALEHKQAADLASDRATDTLAEAMHAAVREAGLSKNFVARKVDGTLSRPTVLDLLRD
jgi:hypothetical protein